jgi:hypothetical protein
MTASECEKRATTAPEAARLKLGVGVIVVLVLAALLHPMAQAGTQHPTTASSQNRGGESWLQHFQVVGQQVLALKPDDKWLIEGEQIVLDMKEIYRLQAISEKIAGRIEAGLRRNSSIPEIAKLRKLFEKRLFVTFFSGYAGGTSRFLTQDKERAATLGPDDQEVTICGRFAANHPKIGGQLLFFNQAWRSLMISAIDWDSTWLEAISLHELYHAKMYREGAPSATAPPMSDLYVQEEVAAHDLEHKVLNLRTKGAYDKLLNEIIRSKAAASRQELISQITAKDLVRLDGLFAPAGQRETMVRLTQYWISLMDVWLKKQGFKKEKLQQEKLANYRLLVSTARQ